MKACAEYDVRLSLHAAGALEPAEAALVEAHLAACPACRAEAQADAGMLAAVRLAAVTDAEREVMRELPARTVGAYRAVERSRVRTRRIMLGGFAAAAVALLAVGVSFTTSTPTSIPTSTSTSTATSTPTATPTAKPAPAPRRWNTPDLDTLWDDTTVVALESAAAATAYAAADGYAETDDDLTATDVVLAAWDDAGL